MADAVALPDGARAALDFWFGPLDEHGLAPAAQRQRWWRSDPDFDAEIRTRFEATWRSAAAGELDGWSSHPLGAVALVLVLDQFPRNMFRDRAEMYATDGHARRVTLEAIESGRDRSLVSHPAVFLYIPLMHSESLVDQHLGMRMYGVLVERSPPPASELLSDNLDFMRRHFEIVERFGRFPHRNAVLGRASTPEERAFLEQPGSSF